jgi:hypothetical protein
MLYARRQLRYLESTLAHSLRNAKPLMPRLRRVEIADSPPKKKPAGLAPCGLKIHVS